MSSGERKSRGEGRRLLEVEMGLGAIRFFEIVDWSKGEKASTEDSDKRIGSRLLELWFGEVLVRLAIDRVLVIMEKNKDGRE